MAQRQNDRKITITLDTLLFQVAVIYTNLAQKLDFCWFLQATCIVVMMKYNTMQCYQKCSTVV